MAGQTQPIPVRSDSSDVVADGGETVDIVYHGFLDTTRLESSSGALVWRMRVRDGGSRTPDLDSLPTVLDSLCLHVVLNDDTATVLTRSIAWAGLYTDTVAPRLIAAGAIGDSTITFAHLAGQATSVPDDSARTFALYLKFARRPVLGDRIGFVVGKGDASARGVDGHEDSTSLFGPFASAASDTTGGRNRITSIPVSVDLRTYPTVAQPATPFSAVAALLDTFGLVIPDPPEAMTAGINSMFGTLTGTTARADSEGLFAFDSLAYSFRNDSATITLSYPGATSASWTMPVTGGAPSIPTVTHAGPWSTAPLAVDGTGVSVRFAHVLAPGSFLTELIDRPPAPGAPPINVTYTLPRYIRITPDTALEISGGFDLSFPLAGLSGFGAGASLYLLERDDSLSAWRSPAPGVAPAGPDAVSAHADGFGELGLGGTSDIAVPVDGLTLMAESRAGGGVELLWRLVSSVRSLGFEVARAAEIDGPYVEAASYERDPALLGAGNDPLERSFTWVDRDAALVPGRQYFYTLTEVKQDGSRRTVGPARATAGEAPAIPTSMAPRILPNPFGEHLRLTALPTDVEVTVRLVDPLGAEALTISGARSGSLDIDTRALPPGAYFYTIQLGAERVHGSLVKLR